MPKKGFHHTEESKKKIGLCSKGRIPWNVGIPITEETKKKMSDSLKGRKTWNKDKKLSKEHCEHLSQSHMGHKLTEEQKHKQSIALKGKKKVYKISPEELKKVRQENWKKNLEKYGHPRSKGGITPLMERIRHSFKYRQWRDDVFSRDEWTCQECLQIGGKLRAHHFLKEFAKIIEEHQIKTFEQAMECEELWSINNGITLCEKCHHNIHKKN